MLRRIRQRDGNAERARMCPQDRGPQGRLCRVRGNPLRGAAEAAGQGDGSHPSPTRLAVRDQQEGRASTTSSSTSAITAFEWTALALANVYGPRQDPHGEAGVVAIFASKMLAGQAPTIFGDGNQTRDYVFVDDVVHAFALAAERGSGTARQYRHGGRDIGERACIRCCAEITGSQGAPGHGPARPGDLRRSVSGYRARGGRPRVAAVDASRRRSRRDGLLHQGIARLVLRPRVFPTW